MFYIGAALAKLTQPHGLLVHLMRWPALVDPGVVQLIGVIELALAIGLMTPLVSWRIFRPVLLICAAALMGEALMMGGYHLIAGPLSLVAVNAVLAILAGVVVHGRGSAAHRLEAGR